VQCQECRRFNLPAMSSVRTPSQYLFPPGVSRIFKGLQMEMPCKLNRMRHIRSKLWKGNELTPNHWIFVLWCGTEDESRVE